MKFSRIPLIALALATAPAMAADVEVSLTDDSVKGQYNAFGANSDIQFGVGHTYHEGSRHITNLDLHAQGRTAIGNLPTTAGLGMRGLYWDDDHLDGGALGLGGYAIVNVPKVPGLSFTGSAHYAPDILSFSDSESVFNVEVRASYRVIRNGEIFAGYRYLNTDLEQYHGDIDLAEGVLAGMKIYF